MTGALTRIAAMALKELRVVLLDRRVLTTLVASPIIQLILFGFATTLEVRNIDIGVVNRDAGIASERLLSATAAVRNVRAVTAYPNERALAVAIERREVIAGLIIPADLSARIARGEPGQVGLLLDGRRVNAAQIVAGYLGEVALQTGTQLRPEAAVATPQIAARHWFNPNLEYRWFTLPGMITLITTVIVLSVSVQAIAREREAGTWDQLMAMPIRSWEILAGKCAPALSVGLFNGALYVLMIPLVSDVPFNGSLGMMLLAVACFSLSVTAIGLCVSSLAQNQQQAFLGGFLVIVPMMLLSGYASPVDSMASWLQPVALIDPLSHMLIICHGLFLKAMPADLVVRQMLPMLAVAVMAFGLANLLLKWRSE
ncbi:ABC-2 type transport system permease protein [Novosphingobium kunmingense]|uniref:Transport permease protein n=1 Tax=Novosphingobium kunmingense TaxID=1211806 RepID=A0A2N0I315_9SPHN|nr:ABC transporter permease [Novosphingobium kunmingense]PKB25586.1 ABC-2 type transport system permease protein [Novosphingobium kunmingense]